MNRFHWLVFAEPDPDEARLLGYADDGTRIRRPLLVLVGVILLVVVLTVAVLSIAQPAAEAPPRVDEPAWGTATDADNRAAEPAWGTATDDDTLVRPPAWWSPEP